MDEERASPPAQVRLDVDPGRRGDGAEEPPVLPPWNGEPLAVREHVTCARDLRIMRARLEQTLQALHQAEAEAAHAPVLQAMLKDAEDALAQRHVVILTQSESLAAAQNKLETAERKLAELAGLAERLAQVERALATAEGANAALLCERTAILGSRTWRLATSSRQALSRLKGR